MPTFAELQTILLPEPYPCTTFPCIDPAFGPFTQFIYYYWSATTDASDPSYARLVWFLSGTSGDSGLKSYNGFYVRAVRGGL